MVISLGVAQARVHVKLMVVREDITPCSIFPISKDRMVTRPVKRVSLRSPRYHRLAKILELLSYSSHRCPAYPRWTIEQYTSWKW